MDGLNGFDETFFMYGEDVDLSYRIQKMGYKNYYLAETSILHFKGESTKKGSLNYVRMFYSAMSIFVTQTLWRKQGKSFYILYSPGHLVACHNDRNRKICKMDRSSFY